MDEFLIDGIYIIGVLLYIQVVAFYKYITEFVSINLLKL
jgi:hypothetical protein